MLFLFSRTISMVLPKPFFPENEYIFKLKAQYLGIHMSHFFFSIFLKLSLVVLKKMSFFLTLFTNDFSLAF